VVSPDSQDKANRAASPDNISRRKVAKVRMKQTKTTWNAIVSVVLRSFPSHSPLGKSRPSRDFVLVAVDEARIFEGNLRTQDLRGSRWQRRNRL